MTDTAPTSSYVIVLASEHLVVPFEGEVTVAQALDAYAEKSGMDLSDARIQLRGQQVVEKDWEKTQLQADDVLVILTGQVASGGFAGA